MSGDTALANISRNVDIENPPAAFVPIDKLIKCYPKLAGKIEILPEIGIFRRFGALNAQILLYLQSELIHLEGQLRNIERRDSKSNVGNKSKYSRDYYWLLHSAEDGDDTQLRIFQEIKEKMRAYSSWRWSHVDR
jgi:hypothetical protein